MKTMLDKQIKEYTDFADGVIKDYMDGSDGVRRGIEFYLLLGISSTNSYSKYQFVYDQIKKLFG